MRTSVIIGVFLSLAVAASLAAGSGFADQLNRGTPAGGIGDKLDKAAGRSPAGDGQLQGSRSAGDEGSIVGLVLSSGRAVGSLLSFVLFIGPTLQSIGAPAWFASTIQSVVVILAGYGIAQFVSGRIFQ